MPNSPRQTIRKTNPSGKNDESVGPSQQERADGQSTSIDPDEIAKFTAMAEAWWDPKGKFKPLHKLNPARLTFIRDRLAAHWNRDITRDKPLSSLRLLDIGCGGGLLCEPLTRLGADVVGIDAAAKNIKIAQAHADSSGLTIDYRATSAEALAEAGEQFDVVLNMEVVEHVADVPGFLAASAALVKPGGATFYATLNRTAKSYLLAIVGAEYVLRWLPRGTHDWQKFLRPSEMVTELEKNDLAIQEMTGVAYNPLSDKWYLAPRDLDVNYMLFGTKPVAQD
ncbi:MAG: bifunctional 2-polyprenyl-6-hydroxyphenol methylase/3-demethylubiquinol 3-O-methyltransferase UbiG [Pseudomonadota bacterium]